MTNPLVDIAMAAAQLKGSAPQTFKDLCDGVHGLEEQAISELMAADTVHDMYRAQGKMKLVQQLHKHLSECTELREGYQRRNHG
jgi:hypothetical protein